MTAAGGTAASGPLRLACFQAPTYPLSPAHQVVVTGAGGRTGALVMKKLLERPSEFSVRGVVRSDKSAAQLRGWGASDGQIVMGDLLENGQEVLGKAMAGADALVSAGWPRQRGGWGVVKRRRSTCI